MRNMAKLKLSLRELLYKKILIKKRLEEKLSDESIRKALNDYHAKKKPRPCGFTVHSVIGCTYRCIYCYIPDIGYSFGNAKAYGLTGEEIVYALLSNPYFLPGRHGSYIAIGSVGEPFLSMGVNKTLEYISAFSKYLGNPIQFSTKTYIDEELARKIASFRNVSLSSLITIISIEKYRLLEPFSPSPDLRFRTIKNLKKYGLHPILFLRPIIPGVNEFEAGEIIRLAKKYGVEGVVIGGFRVSNNIIARLKDKGLKIEEINKRIRGTIRKDRLLDIYVKDIKEKIAIEAKKEGLIPFYSACCASTYTFFKKFGYRIPCIGLDFIEEKFCTKCPVLCENISVEIDTDEAKYFLNRFFGYVKDVEIRGYYIIIHTNNRKKLLNRIRSRNGYRILVETAYRKKLVVTNG